MAQIILASSSKWRCKLLTDIGLDVKAIPADIDEEAIVGGSPIETAVLRADAKAQEVSSRYPDAWVIGADQVCHFNGAAIGKPKSEQVWFERLFSMRGHGHDLTTAVSIISRQGTRRFYETTSVWFREDISEEVLRRYIEIGEAKDCAGGYMMEGRGAWLIERIEGDWQNVIGLPIFPLTKHLREMGLSFFGEGLIGDSRG